MAAGSVYYPNITSLPASSSYPIKNSRSQSNQIDNEFKQILDNTVTQPLKFSAHASQRLIDRKIRFDTDMYAKINEAIDRAEAKGLEDTLVLTPEAALIVNIRNRTVITALDRNSVEGNVFTNIDGAVVI